MLRALALSTLALALVLSGCGDDDGERFRDDYDTVSGDLSDIGVEVQEALQDAEDKSDEELARQFDALADDLVAMQTELAELDPPASAEDDLEKLDAAVDDVAESLRDIAAAAEQRDPDAARTATLELIQRGERLDKVQAKVAAETAG